MGGRILLVSEDAALAPYVARYLGHFEIHSLHSRDALEGTVARAPTALVVDVNEGERGALSVAAYRAATPEPIIALHEGYSAALDVELLDAGADGVLSKPFNGPVLRALLAAIMRRAGSAPAAAGPPPYRHGGIEVRGGAVLLGAGANPLHLTRHERALLDSLIRSAGRVVTHSALLREVWGPEYGPGDVGLVWACVHRLRAKLEEASGTRLIEVEPGVGYYVPQGTVARRGSRRHAAALRAVG